MQTVFRRSSLLLLLAGILLISACGQKGPLYLPQDGQTNIDETKAE